MPVLDIWQIYLRITVADENLVWTMVTTSTKLDTYIYTFSPFNILSMADFSDLLRK